MNISMKHSSMNVTVIATQARPWGEGSPICGRRLSRRRCSLDVGTTNGECFCVMAGAGFDGMRIAHVDSTAKERLGRVAYVRSSVKAMSAPRTKPRSASMVRRGSTGPRVVS
jgi:hypothetical protein